MKKEPFGSILKRLREAASLSLRQLEATTGISNGYLSQIESGRVGAPSPKILEKLSAALDASYVDLMTAAGHLRIDVPLEPALRMNSRDFPLSELTDAERKEVVRFIAELKSKRTRRRD